jgi:hypothetical protein
MQLSMWIVNWGRLIVFAVVAAAIWFAFKGSVYVTETWGNWPGLIGICLAILAAWLIDRSDRSRKE